METTLAKPKKRRKEWHPTQDQVDFIKAKYATYFSSGHTLTKTRLAKAMGVSIPLFERFCQRAKIKPRERANHKNKDFTGYIRVPVPCKSNNPTYLLVAPDRDPVEAKKKYMAKYKRSLEKKPWGK